MGVLWQSDDGWTSIKYKGKSLQSYRKEHVRVQQALHQVCLALCMCTPLAPVEIAASCRQPTCTTDGNCALLFSPSPKDSGLDQAMPES